MRDVGDEATRERLADVLRPVHEHVLERMRPGANERWLDFTRGGSTISSRATEAGAEVTSYVGDSEYLPYDDGEFDAVASAFGFIWAPDHANVASELARVSDAGARLAFTAWKPNPKLGELYRRFTDEPLDGRESTEWGREDHVESMLDEDFELEFEDGTLWIDAASGEELWELFSLSSPPLIGLLRKLDDDQGEELHAAFVELFESYREGGRVRAPRRYLLTLGRRR